MRKSDWPHWIWTLPIALLVLGLPIWMHWFEPGTFIAMNAACAVIAAPVWTGLSLFGNATAVLAITSPLLVRAPRLMLAWICAAPFAVLFARLGKDLIVSPRPAALIDPSQIHIVGEQLLFVSMPSGHTLTAFAVASAIFFSLPRARRIDHLWLFVLAALTGLSRIAVGAHWPGDVIVGASLGLLAGLLGNLLLQALPRHWSDQNSWCMRIIALLVAISIYVLLTDELDFAENAIAQKVLALLASITLIRYTIRGSSSIASS